MKPYCVVGDVTIYQADALDLLRSLPAASVDLIATDPPYFRAVDAAWDNAWENERAFLRWVGLLCREWRRVLKPSGSLYVFASPPMAHGVERMVRRQFSVLNTIRWEKPEDNSERRHVAQVVEPGLARTYYPTGERVVFAEQRGADAAAKGEGGEFLFAPLLAYLREQFAASKLRRADVDAHLGTANVSQYWLQERAFIIPTEERYRELQKLAPGYFLRPYSSLSRENERIREEYERLRRPFSLTPAAPCLDVWRFAPVSSYPGRHPCEKPLAMMEHIVRTSSRPGAVVLDTFCGSGATAEAARNLGRRAIVGDMDAHWCGWTARRLSQENLFAALGGAA